MRRIIAILISIFYLIPTIGYSIDIHWCGNRIAKVSFYSSKETSCGTCATPKKCCKTTHIVVKLKDSQYGSTSLKINPKILYQWSTLIERHLPMTIGHNNLVYLLYRPPPLLQKEPIYLTTKVFRV